MCFGVRFFCDIEKPRSLQLLVSLYEVFTLAQIQCGA